MSKESELRFLKFFIYSMGLVMMLGVLIITYTIYKRNIVLDKDNIEQNQSSKCPTESILIPSSAVSASITQNKLAILTEEQDVLIYDVCKGKLLSKIKLIIK